MSETPVEIVQVTKVLPHPNADKLEVVKVLNTQFLSPTGSFVAGDMCIYFPPDMMIPEDVSQELGVQSYLKKSVYTGDTIKTRCRIGAIRLRGLPSFGFGIRVDRVFDDVNLRYVGEDLTGYFRAVKYQPPEPSPTRARGHHEMRQPVAFHKYTDIQHYYRYAPALEPGTPVRITEKIHGTNSRVGLVNDNGLEYMVGTHHRRLKYGDADNFYAEEIECEEPSIYHRPLTDNMKRMLAALSLSGKNDVVVFGEIYGQRVQQMDYGMPPGDGYRVFDISVNSEYLNWADVKLLCETFGVETVPVLYEGPFEPELVDQFISGPTTLAEPDDIACKFKGREGIVITPLVEAYSSLMNKRLILKAVSSDYYEAMK